MTETAIQIKITKTYVGSLNVDENETTTPVVVAVTDENVPFLDAADGKIHTHTFEQSPLFEIEDIILPARPGGKIGVTFSNKNFLELMSEAGRHLKAAEAAIEQQEIDIETAAEINKLLSEATSHEAEANDTIIRYTINIPTQHFLTFFALTLVGENYLILFDKKSKPRTESQVIQLPQVETLISLPDPDTEEYETILRKVARISSKQGLEAVHEKLPEDENLMLLIDSIRGEVFVLLTELGFGSEQHLKEFMSYIPAIDEYCERVLLQGSDVEKEDDNKIEILIDALDHVIGKTSVKTIIPRAMKTEEIIGYRNTYTEFETLMRGLENDPEFIESTKTLDASLSLHDLESLKGKKDANKVSAFIASPMTEGSLPSDMFHLIPVLDEIHFFENKWNHFHSVQEILSAGDELEGTYGENIIAASIAAIIRMTRGSLVNGGTFPIILSGLLDSAGTDDGFWQFKAFSGQIAKGETDSFRQFLISSPKSKKLSETIADSPLGVALLAFTKSILEEEWNPAVLEASIGSNELIYKFVKDCYNDVEPFKKQLAESGEWDNLLSQGTTENQLMLSLSSQAAMHHISELDDSKANLESLSVQLVNAMVAVADINTGKMTDEAFDSTDWILTKQSYLNGLLELNTTKFFKKG